MARRSSRSQHLPPSPSMANLNLKLARIVSRQHQLKISFSDLKSQIKIGLLEAEDVFSSLAIPLMKLVGLKTAEMAEEGRSTTIFTNIRLNSQGNFEDRSMLETHRSSTAVEKEYDIFKLEEDHTFKATVAGKELIQKQKLQLYQLMQLLKQVETSVNSSQKSIYETIHDHKYRIYTFVKEAITYVSAMQQSSEERFAFVITLKLLKAVYNHASAGLSAVENGVDNLMSDLSEKMCTPMVEFAKRCKAEITNDTCPRLLVALEEMSGAARAGRLELEQARKKVKVAEDRKLEALSMLRESQEKIEDMRRQVTFFSSDKKEYNTRQHAREKLLAPQQDQTKDDKLLWELLKRKRTRANSNSISSIVQSLDSLRPPVTTKQIVSRTRVSRCTR